MGTPTLCSVPTLCPQNLGTNPTWRPAHTPKTGNKLQPQGQTNRGQTLASVLTPYPPAGDELLSPLTCFLLSLLRGGRVPLQLRRRPWGGPPGFCSLLRSGWNNPTLFVQPTLYLHGATGHGGVPTPPGEFWGYLYSTEEEGKGGYFGVTPPTLNGFSGYLHPDRWISGVTSTLVKWILGLLPPPQVDFRGYLYSTEESPDEFWCYTCSVRCILGLPLPCLGRFWGYLYLAEEGAGRILGLPLPHQGGDGWALGVTSWHRPWSRSAWSA